MNTIDQITNPDTQAVIEHAMTGKPLAAEIAKRIHEKAKKIRERILREHGIVDIAVPAIREFRGELPDA